jgi:Xaa-Pro aminopeptidase
MAFTVEPGIYVAPDHPEVEFTPLAHDLDKWTERRILLGTAAAREAEEAELEAAEKVTHTVPEEFLGIGIRIEDDILITADGHENLTAGVPTEIDKIESLCAEPSWLHRT